MNNKDIISDFLSESKKPFPDLSFEALVSLISEQMGDLNLHEEEKKGPSRVPLGARERHRTLRLPNVIPTEISVGQKPSSQDRAQFELWMRNLGGLQGPGDPSAVSAKLKAITDFFAEPDKNLENATLPQTLSYLMFLNQFVWMLQEFNASVAGFLWEPFLAALFGGQSEQVPTSKGDIADIKIHPAGAKTSESISLKILNDTGYVKGSFRDLVKHFASGGQNMRYVVVVKDQSAQERQVSAVTFYEFDINPHTFFDWIGEFKHVETVVSKDMKIKASQESKVIRHKGGTNKRFEIRHAKQNKKGKVAEDWIALANYDKAAEAYLINSENAKIINLRSADGNSVTQGPFDIDSIYIANISHHKPGGKGGGSQAATGYEPLEGLAGSSTDKLWGSAANLSKWIELRESGWDPQELFKAIQDGVTLPDGTVLPPAPGVRGEKDETQFKISPGHYKGKASASSGAGKIGVLSITTQRVEAFFKKAAESLNDDLVVMFNSLASLTDNIGKFFLVDCDGNMCTDTDAADRHQAGVGAMDDASELERAVTNSIKSTGYN